MLQTQAAKNSGPSAFERSLKPLALEEFFDLVFYRRVAHWMVPLLIKLRLSPNQVTTLSLITGLIASWYVLHQQFVVGGLLAMLAIFFDCSDGQIARLTNQTSPFGRIMDGVFDMIWITALWLSIYFSGFFQESSPWILWLMISSAFCMFLHCWRFDANKLRYIELANPDSSEHVKDMDAATSLRMMKENIKKFHLFTAWLCFMNAVQNFTSGRSGSEKGCVDLAPSVRRDLRLKMDPVIKRWTWLGEGHHNTLIILGLLMAPYSPYVLLAAFWVILVPMTLWYIYCEWTWQRVLREAKPLLMNQNLKGSSLRPVQNV